VAIGDATTSSNFSTVALGQSAVATGVEAISIGRLANASGYRSASVGGDSVASGLAATAMGSVAKATANYSTATGGRVYFVNGVPYTGTDPATVALSGQTDTTASGILSSVYGAGAQATADRSLALGALSSVNVADGVALGAGSVATTAAGVAGYVPSAADATQMAAINATTSTLGAVSVGDAATGKFRQINGVAAGTADSDAVNVSQLNAVNSTVVANKTHYVSFNDPTAGTGGNYNNDGATGSRSVALGVNASATGPQTIAMGTNAVAQGAAAGAIAIGDGAAANGRKPIAIGLDAKATQDYATAIGGSTTASGWNSTAVGSDSQATGRNAAGIGANAYALADQATALGTFSTANAVSSTAIGFQARATEVGAVALGAGSTTAAVVNTTGTSINGNAYTFAGTDALSTVSVGSGAAANGVRTITNVAAGRISATSTDAINGSQLNATNRAIQDVSTVAGKGWNLSANGEATPHNIAPGDTADFAQGDNIEITRDGSTITVATAKDVNFDSVTTGNTVMNNAGITVGPNVSLGSTGLVIVNGPSVTTTGIDAGGKVITNVAAGVAPTDAVNVSQLTQASNVASNKWVIGSPTTYTAPVSSGTDSTAVGSGASVNANNSVAVGTGASATTDNSVALGNGSTTSAAVATTGATIAGSNYSFAGGNPTGVVSVGSAGNERQIQNVAAGQLSSSSTDAVNGSQLYATNQAISTLNTSVAANKTHYYSVNDGGVQGANYNNDGASGVNAVASGVGASASSAGGVAIGAGALADRSGLNGAREAFSNVAVASTQGAVSVGAVGGERQITNVAGGTAATDAVNVRQLTAVQQGAVNYANNADGSVNYNQVTLGNGQAPNGTTISNVAPGVAGTDAVNVDQLNAGVAGANQYTDQRFNQTRAEIDKVGKRASAGTAGAMAMANLPQAYIPGKSMLSVGVAGYDGESAIALGVSKLSDNGRWVVKFSGTGNSRGKFGVGAGAGFHW